MPDDTTPALSTNYLELSVPGIHPSNLWFDLEVTSEGENNIGY
jgi:hypothetical protein